MNASEISPGDGAVADAETEPVVDTHAGRSVAPTSCEVPLLHARWAGLLWGAVALALALLCVRGGGPVGWTLTALFSLLGVRALAGFVATFRHAPGVIVVGDDGLALPTALCSGLTLAVPWDRVRHAYHLHRGFSLTGAGPVLVVEVSGGGVGISATAGKLRDDLFVYPRSWFGGEDDPRRIAEIVNRRLGRIA